MPFASNGGIQIYYEVGGQGEPLAMVHGFSASTAMWRDMGYTKALADRYQLILIDPRGHGQSDKPHDPAHYRPESMVADVVAVLDHLGLQKVHYLGASMGAAIGFQIPGRALDRVRSLILLGYGRYGPFTEGQLRFQAIGRRMQEVAASMDAEAALTAVQGIVGPLSPADQARFLANDHRALLAFIECFDNWPGFEEALPGVTVPSLVMAAEGDPHYSSARKCAEAMPRASFATLAGGVHSLDSYGAAVVAPRIRAFLEGIGEA